MKTDHRNSGHTRHLLSVRSLMATTLILWCALSSGLSYADTDIGSVREAQGNAVIVRGTQSLPATKGTGVHKGDMLQTAENARIVFALADGTRIVVGQNSRLSMDEYAFDAGSQQGSMLISFLKGTMRMISGALARKNPGAATIKTPTSTVGIRGTDFIIEVP